MIRIALTAGAALLILAQSAPAQPIASPEDYGAQPGLYIRVPTRAGYLYIPLDDSGRPVLPSAGPPPVAPPAGPAAPRAPAIPSVPRAAPAPGAPSAPGAPAAPRAPAPPGSAIGDAVAYLRTDVEPRTARVYVDGRYAGTAEELAPNRGSIALAPGSRRIEITLAGFKPLRATLDLAARQTYTLVWKLERQ